MSSQLSLQVEVDHAVQACSIGAKSFVSTPVATQAGHSRSFEETYRWVRPLLRRVPVTRVVNATPLDFVGLPVWSAVTPLAKDLTVHAGKGRTPLASKVSAIMEAIERVSAESLAPSRRVRMSFCELAGLDGNVAPIDPVRFDLPFQTEYDPGRAISWVVGYDLIQRRHVWVATDLVISPAEEKVCLGVETNGLASGNTYTEAVVHALYELVERDAVSHELFCDMFADLSDVHATRVRMLDLTTLPADSADWVGQLRERGLTVLVQDLTSDDIEVAVFAAIIVDTDFPAAEGQAISFAGYGADIDPSRAVFRAITEAVQSHTIVTLGARDSFEGTRAIPDRASMLVRRLGVYQPSTFVPFRPMADASSGDLLVDLDRLVHRLSKADFEHCVVVDLTREDLQVPVVRVLVPGLAGPYGSTSRRPGRRLLKRLV